MNERLPTGNLVILKQRIPYSMENVLATKRSESMLEVYNYDEEASFEKENPRTSNLSFNGEHHGQMAGGTLPTGIIQNHEKEYCLVLPEEIYELVKNLAASAKIPAVDLFRRCIMLGLLIVEVEKTPGAEIYIREGDRERRLSMLL